MNFFVESIVCDVIGIDDLEGLSSFVRYQDYERDEIIVAINESGTGVQVVIEVSLPSSSLCIPLISDERPAQGKLEVSMRDLNGKKTVVENVGKGGLVGHWSFVTGAPSIFEIRAQTPCRVATLTKHRFSFLSLPLEPLFFSCLFFSRFPIVS